MDPTLTLNRMSLIAAHSSDRGPRGGHWGLHRHNHAHGICLVHSLRNRQRVARRKRAMRVIDRVLFPTLDLGTLQRQRGKCRRSECAPAALIAVVAAEVVIDETDD